MKPHIFILLFLSFFIYTTCQKSGLEYSCDPQINDFVIKNLLTLSQLNITEFNTYDVSIQRAIFNSWDYKKKQEIWKEKFSYILSDDSLPVNVKNHIQKLLLHLNDHYFLDEVLTNNLAERKKFASEWINYAVNQLGLSKEYLAFLVYRLYVNQKQFEVELNDIDEIKSSAVAESESSCGCNQSADFCEPVNCNSGNCESVPSGCGWLWSMPCDGNCY